MAIRKTFQLILLSLLLINTGCKEDVNEKVNPPSSVDGLKLEFIYTNTKNNFRAVNFVNENNGFIAGYDGALFGTQDGGKTWKSLNSNTKLPLYDIYFLNENEGFVVGGDSGCGGTGCTPGGALILHTTDGGQTWSKIPVATALPIELKSVYFTNDSIGFAVGIGSILTTRNGGATWKETRIENLRAVMMDIEFSDEKNGMIACTNGNLLKTIDGGVNWTVSNPFPSVGSNTIALRNEKLCYSAGYTRIFKSTDFGNTWTGLQSYPEDVFKLLFTSDNVGFSFGRGEYSGGDLGVNYGAIYYTTDGGTTWTGNKRIVETEVIQAASFPSENVGFAVSSSTVIKVTKL